MSKNSQNLLGGLLLITGAVIGAATAMLINENRPKQAGQVLDQVKGQLGHLGHLEGSWIDYDPIEYDLFTELPLVYMGGLTVKKDDNLVQYHFAADIYTGDVIDYFAVEQKSDQ